MNDKTKRLGFLSKIRLTGAAGVGDPAHGVPGWMVIKSAAADLSDDEWLRTVADGWLTGTGVDLR